MTPPQTPSELDKAVEDRDKLGEVVRTIWITWAREQPIIKESWTVLYYQLNEPNKEVDRRIGEQLFTLGYNLASKRLKEVEKERDELFLELNNIECHLLTL